MLHASDSERQRVVDYMAAAAPDERVRRARKAYSELVKGVRHDVWDVHTQLARWWVITAPLNLYSQAEFPNLDLALTFHVGLCLRSPDSERVDLAALPADPLLAVARELGRIHDELLLAQEPREFQAIGASCRAALLALVHAVQASAALQRPESLARSDFRGWAAFLADSLLGGAGQHARRALLASCAASAWGFSSWLAQAPSAHFHDAEAALAASELAVSLFTVLIVRSLRGVPQRCPACGGQRLAIEWAEAGAAIEQWPRCEACDWKGTAVRVAPDPLDRSPALD